MNVPGRLFIKTVSLKEVTYMPGDISSYPQPSLSVTITHDPCSLFAIARGSA